MAIGFRKSLFGFNCDDVVDYIEKTHKSFKEKEKEFNGKISELSGELDNAKNSIADISRQKDLISEELSQFKAKAKEIERLSENIGKLYLVAQANAKAIMQNSENNAKMADEETTKNISSIENAHSSFVALKENILKASEEFASDVDELLSSLSKTKSQILDNNYVSVEKDNEFKEFLASITK